MAGYGRIFCTAASASNFRTLLSNRSSVQNVKQFATVNSKTLKELGIPPKPKKPISSYLKYLTAERTKPEYINSNLKMSDIVTLIGNKWTNLDPREKDALRKEYDLEMLAYSKQIMNYEQSITPEQKKLLAECLSNTKTKNEKLVLKKKCEALGRPKRPPTGFLQFLQEKKYMRNKMNATGASYKEYLKDMVQEWREMSQEEKAQYKLESQKLMEQYKTDMKQWEENMVRKGHIDVVRNRGLIAIKSNNQPVAE